MNKLNELWDYIDKSGISIDIRSEIKFLKCVLCGGIMKRATVSKCGCGFCQNCFENYLIVDGKLCPGCSEDGVQTMLTRNDLRDDVRSNKEISKLSTKCPFDKCNKVTNLSTLLVHMQDCQMQRKFCLFKGLGCMANNDRSHMKKAQMIHWNLTASSLLQLTSENEELRNSLEVERQIRYEEIRKLDEKVKDNDESMTVMKETIKILAEKVDLLQASQRIHVNDVDLTKEEHVMNIIENLMESMTEMATKNEKLDKAGEKYSMKMDEEIKKLKEERSLFENEIKTINTKIVEISLTINKENANINDKGQFVEHDIKLVEEALKSKDYVETPSKRRRIDSDDEATRVVRLQVAEKPLQLINISPFLWKVDDLVAKSEVGSCSRVSEILSSTFYDRSNGYRLRLKVRPNGIQNEVGTHVSVYFRILRGPYDNELSWPCLCSFTLSLLSHDDGSVMVSRTYKYSTIPPFLRYCFQRPTLESNRGLGCHRFISWAELKTNKSAIKNGSILILCKVSPPD